MATISLSPTVRSDTPRDLATGRWELIKLTGWPVTIERLARRLVVTTGDAMDAITMPAEIGQLVLTELRIALQAGPVIAGPGGTWWTFLTESATAPRPVVPADLQPLRVMLAPRGPHTVIPTSLREPGMWSWVAPPRPHQSLPAWSAVISIARQLAVHYVPSDTTDSQAG